MGPREALRLQNVDLMRILIVVALAGSAGCGGTAARALLVGEIPAVGEHRTALPPELREISPRYEADPPGPVLLIPGDLLDIKVFEQPDLALEVRIPPSGVFYYPLIGSVQAARRTLISTREEIRQRLMKDFLHDPSVTVTVKEYAKRFVYVSGGVLQPNGYELRPSQRLSVLRLISLAGGFTDRAYKEYAHIARYRGDGKKEVIRFSVTELEKAVARGKAGADVELMADDLLVIPSAARVVYVLGRVNKPGSFEISVDSRLTVSMAISQAGGWSRFGSMNVHVLRQLPTGQTQTIPVDVNSVIEGRRDKDVELRPGDIVWVPDRSIF